MLRQGTLFWIDPVIRDAYPRDKADRVSEDNGTKERDREKLDAEIARQISEQREPRRLNSEVQVEFLRPLVIRFDGNRVQEERISLFDPTSQRFSKQPIYSSALADEVAEAAVNYLKHRYHSSVSVIVEDLADREELDPEKLSDEEAYVYCEKHYVIEQLRENKRVASVKL